MKAMLYYELAHYNRKWEDFLLTFSSDMSFFIIAFTIIYLIQTPIIGAILLALLFKGFTFYDSAITKHIEKKADKKVYERGIVEGLEELWNYDRVGNKIKLHKYNLYEAYPKEIERHIWITQFKNSL